MRPATTKQVGNQAGQGERLRQGTGKANDLSWFLPLVGLLLFMPPILGLFDAGRYLFGLPLLLVYLFAIWLVGILLTALAARLMLRVRPGDEEAVEVGPLEEEFPLPDGQGVGGEPERGRRD